MTYGKKMTLKVLCVISAGVATFAGAMDQDNKTLLRGDGKWKPVTQHRVDEADQAGQSNLTCPKKMLKKDQQQDPLPVVPFNLQPKNGFEEAFGHQPKARQQFPTFKIMDTTVDNKKAKKALAQAANAKAEQQAADNDLLAHREELNAKFTVADNYTLVCIPDEIVSKPAFGAFKSNGTTVSRELSLGILFQEMSLDNSPVAPAIPATPETKVTAAIQSSAQFSETRPSVLRDRNEELRIQARFPLLEANKKHSEGTFDKRLQRDMKKDRK